MQKVDWEKLAKNLGAKNLELESKIEELKNEKKRREQLLNLKDISKLEIGETIFKNENIKLTKK